MRIRHFSLTASFILAVVVVAVLHEQSILADPNGDKCTKDASCEHGCEATWAPGVSPPGRPPGVYICNKTDKAPDAGKVCEKGDKADDCHNDKTDVKCGIVKMKFCGTDHSVLPTLDCSAPFVEEDAVTTSGCTP